MTLLEDFRNRLALPTTCTTAGCTRPVLARLLCKSHYDERRIAKDLPQRVDTVSRGLSHFVSKITEGDDGCWLWTGALTYQGYGQFMLNRKAIRVHRLAYEQVVGPIPEGLVLDHLCRVRSCCNPQHLEPVTQRINTLRGVGPAAIFAARDACSAGHAYTDESTYSVGTYRFCRICNRDKMRRLRANWANGDRA